MTAPGAARARRRAPLHPVAATVSAVLSLSLLLALSGVTAGESDAHLPRLGSSGWWTVAAVLVVQSLGVTWAGRFPTTVLPGLTALPLVLVWVVPGAAFSATAIAEIAAVFLVVVARPPRRRSVLGVTGLLLATGHFLNQVRAGGTDVGSSIATGLVQALLVVGTPLLLGLVVTAQREAREARGQEVAALRREQDALLQSAVSRERMAMSRELHDIAAHHMSGIALLAGAMDRQIEADPAAAKRSARQVRAQSRAVLDDLRRLVGLLRVDADVARPVESLDAVSALVEARRAAGSEIDLVRPAGSMEGLGPLAQIVAYRMVQESLANAAAHAPGARCTVQIGDPHDGRATITVRNGVPAGPDPGPGGGFGLVGMAERAQLVGGDLISGATPDGGWQVALTLPVEEHTNTEDPA